MPKKRLGEILIRSGTLTTDQLDRALSVQQQEQGLLGEVLLRMGMVHPTGLDQALAEQMGVPFVEFESIDVDPQIVMLVPEDFCRKYLLAPFRVDDKGLHAAMVTPDDMWIASEIELLTGYQVVPCLASAPSIRQVLDQCFDRKLTTQQTIVDMRWQEIQKGGVIDDAGLLGVQPMDSADAPIVQLVNSILSGGVSSSASDIHFEPQFPEMRVRYRVDGVLYDNMHIPDHIEAALISRLKVMADLDVTERRHPQDGHISFVHESKPYDLRISTMPTVCGEKAVVRVLEKESAMFQLDRIGFSPDQQKTIEKLLGHPYGMILVTGPTGSGKSTTLYAMLNGLNTPETNIITLEDPVENRMAGMNQIGVDPEFGMTFAMGLKFILRQDPDVIMVGEIRDGETAQIAVQAALTGHMLLSTLHTNDAAGAVTRLIDVGVQSFLLASSLIGVFAQRLLRRVCPSCKEPVESDGSILDGFGAYRDQLEGQEVFAAKGCDRCFGTGYRGRCAVFELMTISPAIEKLIEREASANEIQEQADQEGMTSLAGASVDRALAGETTLDEVRQRVLVWEQSEGEILVPVGAGGAR